VKRKGFYSLPRRHENQGNLDHKEHFCKTSTGGSTIAGLWIKLVGLSCPLEL
jgi:hypothetical protein